MRMARVYVAFRSRKLRSCPVLVCGTSRDSLWYTMKFRDRAAQARPAMTLPEVLVALLLLGLFLPIRVCG